MNTKRNIKFNKLRGGSPPPPPSLAGLNLTSNTGPKNSAGNKPSGVNAKTNNSVPRASNAPTGGNTPSGTGGNTPTGTSANTPTTTSTNTPTGTSANTPTGISANTPKVGNNSGNKVGTNTPKNNSGKGNNSTLNKIKNTLGDTVGNLTDKGSNLVNSTGDMVDNVKEGKYNKWGFIFVVGISLILIIHFVRYIISNYYSKIDKSPLLVPQTKNAKHTVIISQDPDSINYIPIKRSENEEGIELSYSFWTLVLDYEYKNGEWKHIFHKGNSSSYPNRAPGVWLHPNENKMRVYMNTFDNILEYVDVEDIPVKKWFCTSIVLQNSKSHTNKEMDVDPATVSSHVLDVYINGNLKKSKLIESIPRQNNGDLYVNLFGGFSGYVSKLQYHSYALDFSEIESYLREGPSEISAKDTGEMPPYLDDKWWFKE